MEILRRIIEKAKKSDSGYPVTGTNDLMKLAIARFEKEKPKLNLTAKFPLDKDQKTV